MFSLGICVSKRVLHGGVGRGSAHSLLKRPHNTYFRLSSTTVSATVPLRCHGAVAALGTAALCSREAVFAKAGDWPVGRGLPFSGLSISDMPHEKDSGQIRLGSYALHTLVSWGATKHTGIFQNSDNMVIQSLG